MDVRRRNFLVILMLAWVALGGIAARAEGEPRDADARLAFRPPPAAPRTIRCESKGGKHTYCRTGGYGWVRLERQLSATPCREYDTWGTDADGGGLWVRDGCRAIFRVGGGWGGEWQGPPPGHHPGWGAPRTFDCKSKDFQYEFCPLGRHGRVRLTRNLSSTRCVRGDNWDVERRGIWVDRGCAGRFAIE